MILVLTFLWVKLENPPPISQLEIAKFVRPYQLLCLLLNFQRREKVGRCIIDEVDFGQLPGIPIFVQNDFSDEVTLLIYFLRELFFVVVDLGGRVKNRA